MPQIDDVKTEMTRMTNTHTEAMKVQHSHCDETTTVCENSIVLRIPVIARLVKCNIICKATN